MGRFNKLSSCSMETRLLSQCQIKQHIAGSEIVLIMPASYRAHIQLLGILSTYLLLSCARQLPEDRFTFIMHFKSQEILVLSLVTAAEIGVCFSEEGVRCCFIVAFISGSKTSKQTQKNPRVMKPYPA